MVMTMMMMTIKMMMMMMIVMTMITSYNDVDDRDDHDNVNDDNYELNGTYRASSRFPILGGGNRYVRETAGCVERSIYRCVEDESMDR